MVVPLDTEKLAEYILASKNFRQLRWKVETHLALIEVSEAMKEHSSGEKKQ